MYRKLVFLLLSSLLGASTIEYMGMSFECDEGCSLPIYDSDAQQVVEVFERVIHEVFDNKWGLVDELGRWQLFNPYKGDGGAIEGEFYSTTRYDWESANQILIHNVLKHGYLYGKAVPELEYLQEGVLHNPLS